MLTDAPSQRASFAKQFPKKPDLSKPYVGWTFSKYFGFPRERRPLKADYRGKSRGAREFLDEPTETAALKALIDKLKPSLFAKVRV